jgi:hypothetical protein
MAYDNGDVPVIHCTPPTDPAFLAAARRAFEQANAALDGSVAIYVGTLLRVRSDYPHASIVWASVAGGEGRVHPLWLISREGWAPVELES